MSTIDNKKKIIINSSFFSPTKSKTLKAKSPKLTTSIINPNILKKTLINKIKQHKHKEELQKSSLLSQQITKNDNNDIGLFTDEFKESIHYLDALSKQKKSNKLSRDGGDTTIKNKTLKNPYLHVNLELPEELKTPLCSSELKYTDNDISNIKLKTQTIQQDVPYGCLKNGNKPTYRNWQTTTQKNILNHDAIKNTMIDNNIENKQYKMTEREKKLEMIREKLKFHQQMLKKEKESESNLYNKDKPMVCDIDLSNQLPQIHCSDQMHIVNQNISLPKSIVTLENNNIISNKTPLSEFIEDIKNEPKVMIKKTIKRKYTLGKSHINKRVGILIKDNQTRKKIIIAQKEMKKKPVNEIKNYLKEHGLIKVGTNAPNDVIRKIYESSLLAGDINNNNSEILLHNFVN